MQMLLLPLKHVYTVETIRAWNQLEAKLQVDVRHER